MVVGTPIDTREAFSGCLLGGAVGDALGAPIEFMSRADILRRFGPDGLTDHAPAYGGLGRITDDTQMTLFTADGLIRASVRGEHKGIKTAVGVTGHAYLRWLMTQGEKPQPDVVFGMDQPGWLYGLAALHARRAPGVTCLSALRHMKRLGDPAQNDSKGCGGVMRVAPVGLWMAGLKDLTADVQCLQLASELAGLTHGHPTGQLTSGVFAAVIRWLANGHSLIEGIDAGLEAMAVAEAHERSAETRLAVEQAVGLARNAVQSGHTDDRHALNLSSLGEGWVAEEALAMSLYCALVARDFEHGIRMSVNHSGDSDSTGAITGNLLGCRDGMSAIPKRWLEPLELREEIAEIASDLFHYRNFGWSDPARTPIASVQTSHRYPGY